MVFPMPPSQRPPETRGVDKLDDTTCGSKGEDTGQSMQHVKKDLRFKETGFALDWMPTFVWCICKRTSIN